MESQEKRDETREEGGILKRRDKKERQRRREGDGQGETGKQRQNKERQIMRRKID